MWHFLSVLNLLNTKNSFKFCFCDLVVVYLLFAYVCVCVCAPDVIRIGCQHGAEYGAMSMLAKLCEQFHANQEEVNSFTWSTLEYTKMIQ